MGADGRTSEWRSASLRAYQRRTRAADALIAGAYLSGTNTRRVRPALAAVFAVPVGKNVVSREWRRVKGRLGRWNARPLGEEPIVRLILDGTVVPSAPPLPRERFSRVPGMLGSLEVKVLYPTWPRGDSRRRRRLLRYFAGRSP